MNRPISKELVNKKIEKHLQEIVENNDSLSSALLTIYDNRTGDLQQFAVGTAHRASEQPVQVDSPYHAASVGKTMCATVFGMLVDEGKISYGDKISTWLAPDMLKGLFVIDGTVYCDQVTIGQLLSHTSGVGDYFEGPVNKGKTIIEIMASEPEHAFSPQSLIAFTRDNQSAIGKPGQQFYYSNTGYILLGLILEAIEEKRYADILNERIFEPLGMEDTYLMCQRLYVHDKRTPCHDQQSLLRKRVLRGRLLSA
ncbi:serine hydrolase domain-containing protein [Paenibacillus sp. MMS18-CY102]|uniref:serine hydrolase domain-containing protein n=1 Tax=Paenibacillus sp. MMS18-CY102 TaxID=2682849 RepID=UPI001F1708BA|nr:serine hydrolase domain-containing protein [Paenibacillus sp. MMS18-CY102]